MAQCPPLNPGGEPGEPAGMQARWEIPVGMSGYWMCRCPGCSDCVPQGWLPSRAWRASAGGRWWHAWRTPSARLLWIAWRPALPMTRHARLSLSPRFPYVRACSCVRVWVEPCMKLLGSDAKYVPPLPKIFVQFDPNSASSYSQKLVFASFGTILSKNTIRRHVFVSTFHVFTYHVLPSLPRSMCQSVNSH